MRIRTPLRAKMPNGLNIYKRSKIEKAIALLLYLAGSLK
jgi:hypothetical protein